MSFKIVSYIYLYLQFSLQNYISLLASAIIFMYKLTAAQNNLRLCFSPERTLIFLVEEKQRMLI